MDRTERTIKAIAEAIARGECPPRTTPREWTHFEKQAKAVFYDLMLTVQLHDDDDESSAKVGGDGLIEQHARDSAELRRLCAARDEARRTAEYWKANHLAGNAEIERLKKLLEAKVGGDEREVLSRAIDCLEILNKRPSPLCRDCADNFGTCPHTGLACNMAALIKKARAALSADGGEAGLYRWLRAKVYADRDRNGLAYFGLPLPEPVSNPMFGSVAQHFDEAIRAAIAANQARKGE
ncbi:hypothetical protein ACNHE5_01085 [Pandoraea pnomenusa]|uniref:hypothetical protein n=1 Tax=Pandoraea pnomenusa TaxID=93220 RepID=UPI003CF090D2